MGISGFLKSPADKADVIGGTAPASGLADDDRQLVGVIFPGKDRFHDLSDDHKRRITSIVIDILQSDIYCLFVVVGQYVYLISGSAECRFKQLKVHR